MTRSVAAEWMQFGELELARARRFLEQEDVFAAYSLEQAIACHLAAHLLRLGASVDGLDTDDLRGVFDAAVTTDPTLENYRTTCDRIAQLSSLARYPQTKRQDAPLTVERIRTAFEAVLPMIRSIYGGALSEPNATRKEANAP